MHAGYDMQETHRSEGGNLQKSSPSPHEEVVPYAARADPGSESARAFFYAKIAHRSLFGTGTASLAFANWRRAKVLQKQDTR